MNREIKFGTDGWRAIIAKDFTVENVMRVAKATADWMLRHYANPSVLVGFDCRFGGSLFAQTAINVFCANNIKVFYDTHFVTTPMVSLGTKQLGCELGIIFTASHNPPAYNGYKIKSKHGGPLIQKHIAEIEELVPDKYEVDEKSLDHWHELQMLEYVDLETMYFEHASAYFDLDAINDSELVVAYDAMYGAGQSIFPRLLPHADLLHCEYNPSFYGQAPEPIHKNLQELSEYMRQTKHIDIAMATDGDADRIGLYNRKGEFIDAHHIILLLIHLLHQYKGESGKVVVAFSVSNKVKKLCTHYRLPVQVTKIGFKHICEIMQQEDVLVGGEESGGIAVKGHIPERDGIWDGLLLIEHIAKNKCTLEDLIEEVYAIVGKFAYNRLDLHLDESKKQHIIERCKAGVFNKFGDIPVTKVEDLDGWKYYLQDEETLLIRASGTEPLLRVYAEAATPERVDEILIKAKQQLLG